MEASWFNNWVPLFTVINSIALLIIAILRFGRKKFRPHLEIECHHPKNSEIHLIKKRGDFQYFTLKAVLTNNGSETALVRHISLFPPINTYPPKVLGWEGSEHVKIIDYMRGEELWKGILSLPRLSTPFGLGPKERISLYFLIRPNKRYLKFKEIKSRFYIHVYYSKKKELHWGPINLLWASKKHIEEISKIELEEFIKKKKIQTKK